jgi:putative membrane protein
MRLRLGLLSTVALPLMLAVPALAQQPHMANPNPNAAPAHQLSRADLNFVKEAAIGGMFEVETGKIAGQNTQDPQAKDFGARMVQDHSKADATLTAIATGKGVQVPKELDRKHALERDRLARLHGAQFDREYMRLMVEEHDMAVKVFQKAAQTAHDPDIKQFAQQTLSMIQDHDRVAHNIMQSLTAVGSSRPRQ